MPLIAVASDDGQLPAAWPEIAPEIPEIPEMGRIVDASAQGVAAAPADGQYAAELPPWLTASADLDQRDQRPGSLPSAPSVPRRLSLPQLRPTGADSRASAFAPADFGAPASAPGLPSSTDGLFAPPSYPGMPRGNNAVIPYTGVAPLPQSAPSLAPMPYGAPGQEVGNPFEDALGPGTLLKGGRYRLIQRFLTSNALQPQGNEPPLMVASDIELSGAHVLVQELRITNVRPEDADQIRRQIAQRLAALGQSQGVAGLLDHFSERRRQFLVFELPSGETLLDRIQRTRNGIEETTAINHALQILEVLAGFERQRPGFIHGNLSPAHVILRPSGQVVLVGPSPTLLLHPEGRVEHGAAGGIPGYSAPEQARGTATARSDLYAVCALLHHAVTGSAPAPRATSMHPPARHLNPRVSLELEEAIGNGLRPSPTQRYQTVSDLRAVLQPLASGRRLTHVPEDMRTDAPVLAPVRDARGRLVLPRRKLSQNPLVIVGSILAVVLLVGASLLYTFSPHTNNPRASATPTPNDLAGLYLTKGIGLSGGEFVFDTQRPSNDGKQRGARALAAGDLRGALDGFQSAVTADQPDAEAAIYAADTQILLDKSPYVTVVAAVAFGDDDAQAAARAELQGVFLAQQHVNSLGLLPDNLHVRVLILNSGQDPADTDSAAGVLLKRIQQGNAQHLLGIVGWPESEQTRAAISSLAPSGLAIVSPTSTEDGIGGPGRYFQMVPSNSVQASLLADTAINQLGARHVLAVNTPQDAVDTAMANAFADRFHQSATDGQVLRRAALAKEDAAGFDTIAHTAVSQGDDLIFLGGADSTVIGLAAAVHKVNIASGTHIHILVGSRAYTAALFGVGSSPTAQVARANASALSTLYVTSLANSATRPALNISSSGSPAFSDEYAAQFGPAAEPQGLDSPGPTAILSYDAARVLLAAGNRGTSSIGGVLRFPTPNDVRARLLAFDTGHAYMGAGGMIAFSSTGTLTVKALPVLTLTPVQSPADGSPVAHVSVLTVAGGQTTYCGSTNCVPQ